MYHVPLAIKCIYGRSNEVLRMESRGESADDLVLSGESEEDLRC